MPRPSRETVYKRLELAVQELEGVGGLPLPVENAAIWRDIWYEETHHSTAIEGNTLLLKEVQLLLFEGRAVGSKELEAYLEVQGYARAAEWVYAQAVKSAPHLGGRYLGPAEVREVHRLVVEPVWLAFPPDQLHQKEGPGSFRRHDIEPFAAGMEPPSWTDVAALVKDWIDTVNSQDWDHFDRHPMESFGELHSQFERIHPFRDGNGRVGRLLLNLLLVRYGYPPAIIYKRDRTGYLKALRRADSGDPGLLGELLARSVKHGIDRFLLPGLAGPHKFVPISALAGNGLSHNALSLAAQRGRLQAMQKNGQWYSTPNLVAEYKKSRYKRRRLVHRRPTPPRERATAE